MHTCIIPIPANCVVEPITARCCWTSDHDPMTLEAQPVCDSEVTHLIHWRDGRMTGACANHGRDAFDDIVRSLMDAFEPIG